MQERDLILASFELWLGRSLLDVDREDVQLWLDGRALAPRTRSVYLSALHCFYAWCVDEEMLTADPTVRIRRPLLPRTVPRPIADDDLCAAFRGAPPRMRAWLCLAAYQGLRCKEIAGLRREDVLDRHRPPVLRVWHGKGGHQAILPLNPETLAALRCYGLPSRGYLFTGRRGAMPPSSVSAMGNRYLHTVGIDATMHQLRHWFGTAVWAETKDMRVTQEMMRHSHPGTTAGYSAFDPDLAQAAVERLHLRAI